MKTLKTLILSALMLLCGMSAWADNKNNLVYNSEEVDGLMVSQTVYKNDGSMLSNYMKYNYKYDDSRRMTENEMMKWDANENCWVKDVCMRYEYQGKSVTTTYYRWNQRKGDYVLIPEMTVTMDCGAN